MPLFLVEVPFGHCFVYTGYSRPTATARPLAFFSVVRNYYPAKTRPVMNCAFKNRKYKVLRECAPYSSHGNRTISGLPSSLACCRFATQISFCFMEHQLKWPPTMSSKDSREDLRVFQKGVRRAYCTLCKCTHSKAGWPLCLVTRAASTHSSSSHELDTFLGSYGALVRCWQWMGYIIPEKVRLIKKRPFSKSTQAPLRCLPGAWSPPFSEYADPECVFAGLCCVDKLSSTVDIQF